MAQAFRSFLPLIFLLLWGFLPNNSSSFCFSALIPQFSIGGSWHVSVCLWVALVGSVLSQVSVFSPKIFPLRSPGDRGISELCFLWKSPKKTGGGLETYCSYNLEKEKSMALSKQARGIKVHFRTAGSGGVGEMGTVMCHTQLELPDLEERKERERKE